MTTTEVIKVRTVFINEKGYQFGMLLPEFAGTIDECYEHYSTQWMSDYCDRDGVVLPTITDKLFNTKEEYTVLGEHYMYVGLFNTYGYEAITEGYVGWPGMERDRHGFELMKDSLGRVIPYHTVKPQ